MRLLLDTHALIWWLADPDRLSPAALAAMSDDANEVLVSAVSALEISLKHALGKLPNIGPLAQEPERIVAAQGFGELPVTLRHGAVAGGLPLEHRDPFDRLLIAQARVEELPLVSNEALFDRYGVRRLW